MFGSFTRHAGFLVLACALAGPAAAQPTTLSARLEQVNLAIRQGKFREGRAAALALVGEAERLKDSRSLVRALNLVADAYYWEGRTGDMLRFYERALAVNRTLNDAAGIGRSLYNIAYYYERTEPARMLALLDEARQWADRAGDRPLRMNILNARGTANWNLGRYGAAGKDFEASAKLGEEVKDRYPTAVAYQNVGLSHYHRSEFQHAQDWLHRARAVFTELGLKPGLAVALGNLGNVARDIGDVDGAVAFYQQSLTLHRETESPRGEAAQLTNIGEVYHYGGHTTRAREFFHQALDVYRRIDDRRGIVTQLNNLSNDAIDQGAFEEAHRHIGEARAIGAAIGDPFLIMRTELAAAALAGRQKRPADVASAVNTAVAAAERIGNPYHVAIAHAARADERAEAGDNAAALAALEHAISLHERTGSRTHIHSWHARAGQLLARMNRTTEAAAHFESARALLGDLERLVASEPFRLGVNREIADVHHAYAAFLVAQGRVREAWHVVEEGRARDLRLRLLLSRRGHATSDRERDALGQLSQLQRSLRDGSVAPGERALVMKQIAEAELAYDTAVRAEREGRGSGGRRSERAEGSGHTLETALHFPAQATVVSYATVGDDLLIFRHRQGDVTVRNYQGVTALADRLRFYAARAATPEPAFTHADLGRELFATLLGPELEGAGGDRLVIVADGPLLDVPFAALIAPDGRFLIEHNVLSLAPSLATLQSLETTTARGTGRLLAVAGTQFTGTLPDGGVLPDLPATAAEARAVAAGVDNAVVWTDVSERTFRDAPLDQYQVVHLATHIVADAARPERSAIVFGATEEEDGLMQAREIYAMSMPVSLAVISGCSSGRGQVVAGEGVLGLSHALLAAGARALVLSLWDVGDRATARLMEDFYASLAALPVDAALAEAQRRAIADPARRHPAHWAAFFASGSAAETIDLPRPLPWTWIALAGILVVAAAVIALRTGWLSRSADAARSTSR